MEKVLKILLAGLIASIAIISLSCEKSDEDQVKVTYLVKEMSQEFDVIYLNEDGQTITENITDSISSLWTYTFMANKGDILYLHTWFDELVDPTKFQFRILIGGKVFKDTYNYDRDWGTTQKRYSITRQGTVPY